MHTWMVRGKWGLKDEGRGTKTEEHALKSIGPKGRAWVQHQTVRPWFKAQISYMLSLTFPPISCTMRVILTARCCCKGGDNVSKGPCVILGTV